MIALERNLNKRNKSTMPFRIKVLKKKKGDDNLIVVVLINSLVKV